MLRADKTYGVSMARTGPAMHAVGRLGTRGVFKLSRFDGKSQPTCKAYMTFYVDDKFEGAEEIYARLGKHEKSVACLCINQLDDVDLDVLSEIIARQYRTDSP